MKKIKPKLNPDKPPRRSRYGSNCTVSRNLLTLKVNFVCSDYKCNFTGRGFRTLSWHNCNHNEFCQTTVCPKCKSKLVNFGNANKIPKTGSKERKYWIEKYQQYDNK